MAKELGNLTLYLREKGPPPRGGAQRNGPGDCLSKTHGSAKSKDDV